MIQVGELNCARRPSGAGCAFARKAWIFRRNNGLVRMAWEGSKRNTKNPPGWAKTRLRIFKRDGRRCYICGGVGADEIDHVIAIELASPGFDYHDDSNLRAVHARPCHKRKTAQDAAKARAKRPRITRARPPERHPGLV